MGKYKLKVPRSLKGRLKDVAKTHDFPSMDAVVDHFIDKGLKAYGAADGELGQRIESVVDDQGYSSGDELIEHLLMRGLRAYEQPEDDPEKLQARLRGLGYIE